MKESILKRLKKYNKGGIFQSLQSGEIMPAPNKGYNPYLGIGEGIEQYTPGVDGPSFMGGSSPSPLNTLLNMGKRGVNMFKNNYFTPPSGVNNTMTNLKMEMGGVQPLPGGMAAPIPGSDAIEFIGQSHDNGGIMMDPQTEVEGGETMDQVVMNKGGARDYFFSDHLKKGGMSYANMHKQILQNGGGQQEVNMLAKMQEKTANRDPKQVAKLGGVMKYNEGGRINMDQIRSMYPNFAAEMETLQNYDPNLSEEENRLNENMRIGNYLYDDDDITFVDSYGMNFTPDTRKQMPAEFIANPEMEPKLAQAEEFVKEKEKQNYSVTNPEEYAAEMARLYPEETNKAKDQLAKILNPGMPTIAKYAAGAQFLPAITAMLTKQKDPEQFDYTPGFTSPIVSGRVKGLNYEAPNQNEARARLASAYTGEQKFIDTSGAGAAGLSNRQALFARKLAAEGTLGAQESKDQLQAENLTKQSQQKAEMMNVQNELRASMTNAQLIQKEADRKQAVDAANTQLRNMRENEKIANRMSIVNNLASGLSGLGGDLMSYNAQERLAKAMGGDGIYQRDLLSNYLSNQPENKNKTKDEINQMVLKILNT